MQLGDSLPTENQPPRDPNNQSTEGEAADIPASQQESQEVSETQSSDPPVSVTSELMADDSQNPPSAWKYNGEDPVPERSLESVSWSASEFIEHEKQISWFAAVVGIAAVVALVIYLVTKDIVNIMVIIVVAVLFAAFGARKPRTLKYGLDAYGIHIATRSYNYGDFKSFAIMQEGAVNSIHLSPLKRFATPISLYFPPDQEEVIIAILGSHLPNEIKEIDPIDRLMRKVRF